MTGVRRSRLIEASAAAVSAVTLRAFERNNILNPIVAARDGVEAIDFLFARGAFAERARKPLPTLIVLDLKLPKLDVLGVEGDPRRRADQAHSGGNPDVVQIVPHLHLDALLAVQPERVTVLR
jgi:CheY-like chemotaxis protein